MQILYYLCAEMKAAILLTILTASLTALTQNQSAPSLNSPKYLNYVEIADSLAAIEQWEQAEDCLRSALRLEPANPANQLLLANMGMILTARGKYGDALTHLNAALALNPHSFLALKHRGITYSAISNYRDAAADFTAALEIDSLDTDVRCLRATVYAISDSIPLAVADYSKVLEKDRDNLQALEGLSTCCLTQGDHDQAIPYLNRIIELKPDPEQYFLRGLAFARLGRFTEASADANEGLRHDLTNGNLFLLRAYIEKLTYRINEAKDDLEKAVRYGADNTLRQELLPDL